jgi:hypothetical protein
MHVSAALQNGCAATHSDEQTIYRVPISDERVLKQPEQYLPAAPEGVRGGAMGFGIFGVMLLDPVDILFILVGALAFTPRLFQQTEHWVQARFPKIHREGRRHRDRFLDDFERRYPPGPH